MQSRYNKRFLRRSPFSKQGYDGVYKAKIYSTFDLTMTNSSVVIAWDNVSVDAGNLIALASRAEYIALVNNFSQAKIMGVKISYNSTGVIFP